MSDGLSIDDILLDYQRAILAGLCSCVGDLIHELTEARQTIKTQGGWLDKTASDRLAADTLRGDLAKCLRERDEARAEAERLRGELSDVRSAHRAVLDEPCAKDEQHCTCVPFLRAEVEQLKARIEEYQAACEQKDGIVRGSVVENQALVDCRAEVERLKARECPGLEEHDAYQHMATRALRAEAEVERLKAKLSELADGWSRAGAPADWSGDGIYCALSMAGRNINVLADQAARYREALELVWPLLDARLDPTCRVWNAVNQALRPAGREQNNDGAKASDPRSLAGSDSVSLRGGDTSPSGAGAIPAAPPSVTPSKSTHNSLPHECWAFGEPHQCVPRDPGQAEPDDPTDAETHHLAADADVAVALREANRDHTSAVNFSGQGEYQTWLALGHIIRAIEALAGRGNNEGE